MLRSAVAMARVRWITATPVATGEATRVLSNAAVSFLRGRALSVPPGQGDPPTDRRVEQFDFCVIGGGPAGWAAAAVRALPQRRESFPATRTPAAPGVGGRSWCIAGNGVFRGALVQTGAGAHPGDFCYTQLLVSTGPLTRCCDEQRAWDLGKKTVVVEKRGGLGGQVVWSGLSARVMLEYAEALERTVPRAKARARAPRSSATRCRALWSRASPGACVSVPLHAAAARR